MSEKYLQGTKLIELDRVEKESLAIADKVQKTEDKCHARYLREFQEQNYLEAICQTRVGLLHKWSLLASLTLSFALKRHVVNLHRNFAI